MIIPNACLHISPAPKIAAHYTNHAMSLKTRQLLVILTQEKVAQVVYIGIHLYLRLDLAALFGIKMVYNLDVLLNQHQNAIVKTPPVEQKKRIE